MNQRIDFSAAQYDKTWHIQPGNKHQNSGDWPVYDVVLWEVVNVKWKYYGCTTPQQGGWNSADKHIFETEFFVGQNFVQRSKYTEHNEKHKYNSQKMPDITDAISSS